MAPLVTRNPAHIRSMHTLLYFICYTMAAIGAIIFSAGVIVEEYLQLNEKNKMDTFVFVAAAAGVLATFLIFYRTTKHADNMAEYVEKTAYHKRRVRLKEEKEADGVYKAFKHYLVYFIYPKIQDLEKPVLIIFAFIMTSFLQYGRNVAVWHISDGILALFILDFLAYQARYQINDLRDMDEDVDSDKRLFLKGMKREPYIIQETITVAVIKICLAIALTSVFGNAMKKYLYFALIYLLSITVIYEYVKTKGNLESICFWVGSGYPLRCFVGMIAADPLYLENVILISKKNLLIHSLVFIAIWAMGTMAASAIWCNSVMEMKKNGCTVFKKIHFSELAFRMEERYQEAQEHAAEGKIFPLRERGRLNDIWNKYYFAATLCLSCAVLLACGKIDREYLIAEIVTCILSVVVIRCILRLDSAAFSEIQST